MRGDLVFLDSLKGNKIIDTIIVIILTLIFCKIIDFVFKKLKKSKWNFEERNTLAFKFMSRFIMLALCGCSIIIIISNFIGNNQYLSTLLASSGVITVILGFAAQESLNNIISGFFIMIFKPFVIGDRVVLANSNITGYVEDITLRHTIIRTYFNSRYILPNSKMNSEIIENSTLIDKRSGMFLDVTIDINSDIDKAINTIQKTIAENEFVLDMRSEKEKKENKPIYSVVVRNISIYGIELRSNIWCENVDISFKILSDLRIDIIKRLKSENIKLSVISSINPFN